MIYDLGTLHIPSFLSSSIGYVISTVRIFGALKQLGLGFFFGFFTGFGVLVNGGVSDDDDLFDVVLPSFGSGLSLENTAIPMSKIIFFSHFFPNF